MRENKLHSASSYFLNRGGLFVVVLSSFKWVVWWCQEGRVSEFKDLPLRKWGEGQVCCFLDEPALLFPSFASLPFYHMVLHDPSILHLLRDRRVWPECRGVNLIPKQQCDSKYDSSVVINSRSVGPFSFTFLSCVLVQLTHSYKEHYLCYLSALSLPLS